MGERDRRRGRGAEANRGRKLTDGGRWPSRKEKRTTEKRWRGGEKRRWWVVSQVAAEKLQVSVFGTSTSVEQKTQKSSLKLLTDTRL